MYNIAHGFSNVQASVYVLEHMAAKYWCEIQILRGWKYKVTDLVRVDGDSKWR